MHSLPSINKAGEPVTWRRMRHSAVNFSPQWSLFPHLSSSWPQGGDWGNEVLPMVTEGQVWDHLRNLNIHKSMGPNKMHPGSRVGCCSCCRRSPSYLKNHGSKRKSLVPGEKGTRLQGDLIAAFPYLKGLIRKTFYQDLLWAGQGATVLNWKRGDAESLEQVSAENLWLPHHWSIQSQVGQHPIL